MKSIRNKIEVENKKEIYYGLKIGLISFLIICFGFALYAIFGLAIGKLMVYIGMVGVFMGFGVHAVLFLSRNDKNNT